jgi:hypothetical protein
MNHPTSKRQWSKTVDKTRTRQFDCRHPSGLQDQEIDLQVSDKNYQSFIFQILYNVTRSAIFVRTKRAWQSGFSRHAQDHSFILLPPLFILTSFFHPVSNKTHHSQYDITLLCMRTSKRCKPRQTIILLHEMYGILKRCCRQPTRRHAVVSTSIVPVWYDVPVQ